MLESTPPAAAALNVPQEQTEAAEACPPAKGNPNTANSHNQVAVRNLETTRVIVSPADVISSVVVSLLMLNRTELVLTSFGQPIATSAGAGSAEPLAQVLPKEHAMPSRSRFTSMASPSSPGKAMLNVLGRRSVCSP